MADTTTVVIGDILSACNNYVEYWNKENEEQVEAALLLEAKSNWRYKLFNKLDYDKAKERLDSDRWNWHWRYINRDVNKASFIVSLRALCSVSCNGLVTLGEESAEFVDKWRNKDV